jgi:M6 family metalloprotease-like protein
MPSRPTPLRVLLFSLVLAVSAFVAPPAVPRVAAATGPAPVADCVLPSDGSMGAIDWDLFRRPVGTLRAAMLFVDFPDAVGAGSPSSLYERFGPPAAAWLAASSFGKLQLAITPLDHWLRMPSPISGYRRVNGALEVEAAKRYIADAVAAADPAVDFAAVDLVLIVPAESASAYPRSSAGIYEPDEAPVADGHALRAVVTLGSSLYERGYTVLAHETSHLFGPRDYYNTTDSPTDRFAGAWSLMADPIAGGDHFALDKWRMGWFADSQVRCVTAASRAEYVLSPVETRGGVKLLVLRTGLRTALTVEFRSRLGLDTGLCSTGVVIAKVNSALKGGAGPIRVADARPRSARGSGRCSAELADAAFGRGGRWTDTSSGLTIDVLAIGSGARVRVTRTKTYVSPITHLRSLAAFSVAAGDGTVTVTAAVDVADGFAGCVVGRPVSLQEWKAGEWWTLRYANVPATGPWTWTFAPEPGAAYRLLAPEKVVSATDVCSRAVGPTFVP